jgi:hypothetical protein
MDSHKDVHLPGIWKKTLQENKDLYLLEEHKFLFQGIITDQVKAYTQLLHGNHWALIRRAVQKHSYFKVRSLKTAILTCLANTRQRACKESLCRYAVYRYTNGDQ